MKKVLVVLGTAMILVSLAACGNSKSSSKDSSSSEVKSSSMAKAKKESSAKESMKKESSEMAKADSESKIKAESESKVKSESESTARAASESNAKASSVAAESSVKAESAAKAKPTIAETERLERENGNMPISTDTIHNAAEAAAYFSKEKNVNVTAVRHGSAGISSPIYWSMSNPDDSKMYMVYADGRIEPMDK